MKGYCSITQRKSETMKVEKFDSITEEKLVIKIRIEVTWQ